MRDHEIGALTDVRICELYLTDLRPEAEDKDAKPVTKDFAVEYLMDTLKITREQAVEQHKKNLAAVRGETPGRVKKPGRGR